MLTVYCDLELKPQTVTRILFDIFGNYKPHEKSSKPHYIVRFSTDDLCGLGVVCVV